VIVLDTHALLWLDQGTPSLGPQARARADEALAGGSLAVCALSFWETAMLRRRGRIEMSLPIVATGPLGSR
jgi:PIN domain nuclease of toxin-antitoxin system